MPWNSTQWVERDEMAIWDNVASNVGLDWNVSAFWRLYRQEERRFGGIG